MSMYFEMIRIRFLMMLAYRTNYYSGILIYSINIGAYYFLWSAIYGDKDGNSRVIRPANDDLYGSGLDGKGFLF